MSTDTPNLPAFPIESGTTYESYCDGLSMRDYFAAKAMQALLREANSTDGSWLVEANASYEIADAMLAARGGEK